MDPVMEGQRSDMYENIAKAEKFRPCMNRIDQMMRSQQKETGSLVQERYQFHACHDIFRCTLLFSIEPDSFSLVSRTGIEANHGTRLGNMIFLDIVSKYAM